MSCGWPVRVFQFYNNNLFYSNIGTSDGDLVQGVVTLIGTGVVTETEHTYIQITHENKGDSSDYTYDAC